MSFADWTRTVPQSKTAATPATPATDRGGNAETVATVATVADTRKAEKDASPEVFSFSPPSDPANDSEALAERAAIMAEANGWDDATALQEARWQADRERCWRAFLRNAGRILEAPAHQREDLLRQYQEEAGQRYGAPTARDMAQSLRGWVRAREVH